MSPSMMLLRGFRFLFILSQIWPQLLSVASADSFSCCTACVFFLSFVARRRQHLPLSIFFVVSVVLPVVPSVCPHSRVPCCLHDRPRCCLPPAADVKRVGIWWAGVEAWMSQNLPEVVGTLNAGGLACSICSCRHRCGFQV